ncbi:hypothetical protein KF913_16475 [Candidatus Obscuribacterales bacterium]|nr:hypothetical protein [Candidatus Obscuribacterales bacterium]
MPRTLGRSSSFDVSRLDYIVETDRADPEHISKPPDEVSLAIGKMWRH